MVTMLRHRRVGCVPAQLGIFSQLRLIKDGRRKQVILEMSVSKLALRLGDGRRGSFKARGVFGSLRTAFAVSAFGQA
jgi:hypothetical protein